MKQMLFAAAAFVALAAPAHAQQIGGAVDMTATTGILSIINGGTGQQEVDINRIGPGSVIEGAATMTFSSDVVTIGNGGIGTQLVNINKVGE